MRRGEARVCVGPRSAVFAPFEDLGLIVVDEEHDSSYKQEGDPRYDARVVAERRAELEGALLLAGSATPRPESQRALRAPAAAPSASTGARCRRSRSWGWPAWPAPLHERTRQALDGVRRRGEKAIVLLNRRGWSNFLSCRLCGRVWECPDCDVTLVLHRAAGEMACHHCGHREPVPPACPECGSVSVARHGAGTEQLERELEALVAPAAGVPARLRRGGRRPASAAVLRALRRRPRRACWWAPRWWPRGTTSRTSRWAWCSTPTRRCAFPTSAPRSARSRSWRSSPGAAAAASAAAA